MASKIHAVWCNAQFPEPLAKQLQEAVAPHRLVWSNDAQESNLTAGGPDKTARSSDVIFGQPHPDDVIHSTALKWVHLNSAGYTRYDNDGVRNALRARGAIMTNSSTVFADPCAEHALAFMLAQARVLPSLFVNSSAAHGWPFIESRNASRLLRGQSALMVGYGAIAKRLVELLAPFEMKLTGIRRSAHGDEAIPIVPLSQIDEALDSVDHVINILPAAKGTAGFFNRQRFSRLKRGAIFYNIGRGDTVDQDALIESLQTKHLAAAYLDVTTPEPLPPDHPLWSAPNCYVTPHVAGGQNQELLANAEHFIANFRRFLRREELRDRIM